MLQCSVTLKCSEMIMFRLGLIWAIKRSIVPHFSAEINCILMQKQWKLLMFRCCSYFKNAILHRLCRVESTLYSRASLMHVFHDTMICTMKDIKQFLWPSFIMRGTAQYLHSTLSYTARRSDNASYLVNIWLQQIISSMQHTNNHPTPLIDKTFQSYSKM